VFIPDRAITPIYYHSWHIKSATHRPYRCSFTQLNFWITDFCSFPYRAIDLIGTKLVDLNFLSTWYQFMTFTNHVRVLLLIAFQALISSSVLFSKMTLYFTVTRAFIGPFNSETKPVLPLMEPPPSPSAIFWNEHWERYWNVAVCWGNNVLWKCFEIYGFHAVIKPYKK
jgi:hypothetical protein